MRVNKTSVLAFSILLYFIALSSSACQNRDNEEISRSNKLFSTTVIPVGTDPRYIAVADVNHDYKPDIIVVNVNSRVKDGVGSISILLGDGKGNFRLAAGSPIPVGHHPHDIGIGDFNNDGNLDLVVPNHQTPFVRLFLGDGKGKFREAPHSPFSTKANPHPHSVVVGYFCGSDKPLDVVIDSWGSNQIELLIGDGKGNLSNGPFFSAGPGTDEPIRSADFNRDGMPDIVNPGLAIGHWNANNVTILLGDGHCGFCSAPGSPFPAGAEPWMLAVGDMNGDGNPDLIITPLGAEVKDPKQISATVLLNNGKGQFAPMKGSPFTLTGCKNPGGVAAGDFNGDRIEDFVVTCMGSNEILLFEGKKSGGYNLTNIEITGTTGTLEERGVTLADLKGNGKDDIIVANPDTNSITVIQWHSNSGHRK